MRNLENALDLTELIEDGMPFYPGDPHPHVSDFKILERDGVNIKSLYLGTHSGTHVDAPHHFLEAGKTLDQLDIGSYSGEGVVLDLSGVVEITQADIPDNIKGKVVLIYTGTSEKWRQGWDMHDFSYLSLDAAKRLVQLGARVVGIDSPSVESPNPTGDVHRELLSHGVLIIENVSKRIKELAGKRFFLLCLPLRVRGGDGAPARVIALPE